MPTDVLGFLYAGAVASGGCIGYFKAGSVPSLVAGCTFGTVLGIGAYYTSRNPENYGLQLFTSALLAGVMGFRFYRSGKLMPAGLVTLLSVGMIGRIAVRAFATTQPPVK
ncbi:transmembrane protein 14C isoform X3 [Dendroctonus ponderosae]